MYYFNEAEREYRYGDHGPKYLEKGPRFNFGIVQLQPENTVSPHVHRIMQECFFILSGSAAFYIRQDDGTWRKTVCGEGDFIHLEPGEVHKICNESDAVLRMIVTAAPFAEGDKESVKE